MVVQYNNYGKSSIIVNDVRTLIRSGILIDFLHYIWVWIYTIFYDNDLLLLVKRHDMTYRIKCKL